MTQSKLPAAFAVALACVLMACRSGSTNLAPDPKAREMLLSLSASEREIVRSDNGFGLKMFSELAAKDEGGNIIVSPLSVSMALTMAYNGARGSTETAMADVLGYGGQDRASINALYAKLIPALIRADPKVAFSLANSIWADTGLNPEQEFIDLNRETFGATAATLDFGASATVPTINKWVSDNTKGLIPTIVEAPLDPDLVMLLINALYFKGNWSKPFDPKSTYDGDFHLADGSTKTCRMMRAEGEFLSFHTENASGVQLPYGDSLYAMVLLQPKVESGMAGVMESLEAGALEGWLDGGTIVNGLIHVPKFKLEFRKILNDPLVAMGMGAVFGPGADFTGIRKTGGLEISEVIHKTFINVDEKGTEAAAVTSVGIKVVSMPADLLRLDRPFVFAIREKTSGALIFLGRIMDPTL